MNPLTLTLADRFTPEEAAGIDRAAVRAGTTPESIAETAAVAALRSAAASKACFRLRVDRATRQKLEIHARALGCQPGALALFLLRAKPPETVVMTDSPFRRA